MSLAPPPKVRKLQDALHSKAKDAPGYRFYALYDELYREDILRFAYDRCQANGGAPGVDGQDFEDIESQGLDAWLGALTTELREATYRPEAVRRVNIPKDGQPGEFRPLGIPCIKDRVVQMAAVLVLEPIFEADLQLYDRRTGNSYTGAQPSPKEVRRLCRESTDLTKRTTVLRPVADQVGRLNRKLRGWWNDFRHGTVGRAYRVVNNHVEGRLRRWLCEEHKESGRGYTRDPSRYLYQDLGLVRLRKLRRETGP